MALKVIGSGFGRTGTSSLKRALEQVGLGPCYHMTEVFAAPDHIPLWHAAGTTGETDWDRLFLGYGAAVDWPTAAFWPTLMRLFPDAKIVHTERPEDDWYRSFSNTIQPAMLGDGAGTPPGWKAMVDEVIGRSVFGGGMADEAACRTAYREANAAVRAQVPADRLLVFDPSEGWGPLCRFLGVETPSVPYPHENTTRDFQALMKGLSDG